jgi:hypothetical protein
MNIITRAAARSAGLKTYYTGKPCLHGHVAERRTDNGQCVCCKSELGRHWRAENHEYMRQYRAENAEARREYDRQYRAENAEAVRERKRQWHAENAEAVRERCRQYYAENAKSVRERIRQYRAENAEAARERCRQYRANNPHKVNALSAKRRAAKIQRTPQWLSDTQLEQIEAFYKQAKDLTDLSGTEHHVDHIVPLQGKTVSGLHVPWNLQVITAKENLSKNNKLGP